MMFKNPLYSKKESIESELNPTEEQNTEDPDNKNSQERLTIKDNEEKLKEISSSELKESNQ